MKYICINFDKNFCGNCSCKKPHKFDKGWCVPLNRINKFGKDNITCCCVPMDLEYSMKRIIKEGK